MQSTDPTLQKRLFGRYRVAMLLFIAGLVVSGLTTFPLLYELRLVAALLGIPPDASYLDYSGLHYWIAYVREGLETARRDYPFLAYGTDWLAFGHLVIALFFFGPLFQPAQHTWILVSGIIACLTVPLVAMICGPIRGIPLTWRLIDCSFGALGLIPLIYCLLVNRKLQRLATPPSPS